MTVQNVTPITDTSADNVTVPGPRDVRCVDVTPDRSPREPIGGGTVRSRDIATAVLPEHQLRTRFRHVYAGRRYAAPGRLAGQSGTSKVFSCVTTRYRTDLLRRLKEARSVDYLDHTAPPDARRPGDWLSGRGILARAAGQAGSSPRTVAAQRNVEQSGVNVERRNTHGLAPADRITRPLGRHTVEFSRATDGSPRLDETTAAPVNASANPPMTYGRISSAAAAETVCSCPAVCRGHDADQTDRPYTGRSHPARLRMKLSSRLSHEAQCAINETRRDMGVSLVGSDSVSDDKAKETTTTSTSTTDSVKTTGARPVDVTAPAEGSTIGQHCCITSRQAQAKDSIFKIRLIKQPASAHPDNTHANTHNNTDSGLPALTSLAVETAALNVFSSGPGTATYNNTCLLSLSQCYRAVPLLRKAREQTFEITPPWYDSRYTDYPAPPPLCAPMEPPKDIKAQAVAKCRDWINKYL